jgi:CheY-like chemotaxis protein
MLSRRGQPRRGRHAVAPDDSTSAGRGETRRAGGTHAASQLRAATAILSDARRSGIALAVTARMPALSAEIRETAVDGPLEGLRILVVEDQRDLRELFVALLIDEGATVAQAATGAEAIALATTHAFDAVLTDLGLPDVGGEIVVAHVTARPTRPVVLVVSGHDDAQLARATAAGADAVFRKPIQWERIVARLRRDPERRSA